VELAARMTPWLGDVVLWVLLTLYAFCIVVPLYDRAHVLPAADRAGPALPLFERRGDSVRRR
jgi:hypothetical protein